MGASHRVSDERLAAAALVLFLLAADVVESEEQVMPLGQTGRQSQFHLFVEVWRPAESNRRRNKSQQGKGKKKVSQHESSETQIQEN